MGAPPIRALVFMTGRNCARYVTAALESLIWQTHPDLHVLYVDDASDDGTAAIARGILDEYFDGRYTLVCNSERWGKARNAHVHLRSALGKGDFVAILDADDQLVSATVVEDLAREYRAGFDVVWTNFRTDRGGAGGNGPLDPFRSPRQQGWKTSHFFSFRACLLEHVTEDYFLDPSGDWLHAACDFAIAFPILDQTRRYRYLPVQAYRYTSSNPESHHNRDPESSGLNSRIQQANARVVLAKPPLDCTRWLFGSHGAADAAVHDAVQRASFDRARNGQAVTASALRGVATPPSERSSEWNDLAAGQLAQRCPGLLNLMMDSASDALDPAVLWRWWTWLQRGHPRPRILEMGGGELGMALHSLAQGLGGSAISVCTSHEEAIRIYARLHTAGIESDVFHTAPVEARFEGVEGTVPDLQSLPVDSNGFDLAVVSAGEASQSLGLLALPVVVPRLNPERFDVCLWAPGQPGLLSRSAKLWRKCAPELTYAEGAFGGAGLIVRAA